jgi:hypothetical protein
VILSLSIIIYIGLSLQAKYFSIEVSSQTMKYLLFTEGVAVEVELRRLLSFLAAATLADSLCVFLQFFAN